FYQLDADGNTVKEDGAPVVVLTEVENLVNGTWKYEIPVTDLAKFTSGDRYRVNVRTYDTLGNTTSEWRNYTYLAPTPVATPEVPVTPESPEAPAQTADLSVDSSLLQTNTADEGSVFTPLSNNSLSFAQAGNLN